MKLILKPKDNEPHDSGSKTIRCRNITQSGSNAMVDEDDRIKIHASRHMGNLRERP